MAKNHTANFHIEKAKRQHILWIAFSTGSTIKNFIIPIIFSIIAQIGSHSSSIKFVVFGILSILFIKIIFSFFRWWNFKYVLTDDELQISEGRLVKEHRFIPFERIQSIQQNTLFFHSMFGLTSLSFQTAVTHLETSIKLEMISRKEAAAIQNKLKHFRKEQKGESDVPNENNHEFTPRLVYKMSLKDIIVAAFTSFSILIIIPVILTIYDKASDFLNVGITTKRVFRFVNQSIKELIFAAVLLLIFSAVLGLIVTYLRYGRFTVRTDAQRIYITNGFFNRTEFTITKAKVNGITLHKRLVRKWFGVVEVKLISSGNLEDDDIKTDVLFPLIKEHQAKVLISELLPEYANDWPDLMKPPLSSLLVKMIKPRVTWVILTVVLLLFYKSFWYLSLAYLFIIFFMSFLKYIHLGYRVEDPFIFIQNGVLTTVYHLTTKEKIEEIKMRESWLQRQFGLATLVIFTRAKPIHIEAVDDLSREAAINGYTWYKGQRTKGFIEEKLPKD